MTARLDRSTTGVVVCCTACIGWSRIADGVAGGHDIAVSHEKDVHPGTRQAYMNRAKFRERLRNFRDTPL